MYIRRDAVKVVLSSPPFAILLSLSLSRVVSSCLFFLNSLLFISFASLSSRSWCMCIRPHPYVYTERGKFSRYALYLRRASTSNGFDALGRNAYLSRAECVCTHVCACVCVCVCGAIPHARVRVDVHTRARPDPATRDAERREDEGGFTHTHTHGAARA